MAQQWPKKWRTCCRCDKPAVVVSNDMPACTEHTSEVVKESLVAAREWVRQHAHPQRGTP